MKFLKLPIPIELIRHSQQTAVVVGLDIETVRDWCLALCLLKEKLADRVVVSSLDGRYKLELQTVPSPRHGKIHGNLKEQTILLKFLSGDLDYLLEFCLKYYRDGYAEVDHLDLEARVEELGEEDVYVTLKFAEFAPPVSSEEAMRRLRD